MLQVSSPFRSRGRSPLLSCVALVLAVSLPACGLRRVVPIQFARLPQMEHYEQLFEFDKDSGPEFYEEIDTKLAALLGQSNWQEMKDLYGIGSIRDDLRHDRILVKGTVFFIVYLNPTNHNKFVVEGMGRYLLLRRGVASEILLAGDFLIEGQEFLMSNLDAGELDVDVELYPTRIPGAITRFHKAELTYRLSINTEAATHGVYFIDSEHEVLLNGKRFARVHLIGDPTDKIIDFRGASFLRKDYEKKFREP